MFEKVSGSVTSCHVVCDVMSRSVTSCHVVCDVMSRGISPREHYEEKTGNRWSAVFEKVSGSVTSCHVVCDVMSRSVTSCHVVCDVMSRGISPREHYEEKTGNRWSAVFEKVAGSVTSCYVVCDVMSRGISPREHYEEKTGNRWGAVFEKVAGRMYRLDLDYGPGEEQEESVKPGSLTKLHTGEFLSGKLLKFSTMIGWDFGVIWALVCQCLLKYDTKKIYQYCTQKTRDRPREKNTNINISLLIS